MRTLSLAVLAVVLTVVFAGASWAGAPTYPIGHMPNEPNLKVRVEGRVDNVKAVNDPLEPKFKYTFTIQDKSGTITCFSAKPKIGDKWYKVAGTTAMRDGLMTLNVTGGFDLSDWRVWALVGLGIAAIVLVVMLLSPGGATTTAEPPVPVYVDPAPVELVNTPVDTSQGMRCLICGHINPADATFCEKGCGQLGSTAPTGAETQAAIGSAPASPSDVTILPGHLPETTVAELFIIDAPVPPDIRKYNLSKSRHEVGRESAQVRLNDPSVSRKHAVIWWSEADGGFNIQDDASAAGTIVNGERITAQTRLNDNDEIILGKTKLKFRVNP